MCLIAAIGALGSTLAGGAGAVAAGTGFMGTAYTGAAVAAGAMTAANVALGAYSAYSSTASARAQAKYQRQTNEVNATLAAQAATEAERIGYDEAQKLARKNAAARGEQVAAMVGAGLDVTTGTPADVIKATDYFGGIDVQTVAQNARKAAWGHRVEQQNYLSTASAYGASTRAYRPALSTGLSLIGSAGDVAEKWASRKVRQPTPEPEV